MEDRDSEDSPLHPIVAAMKVKFLKYWEKVPLLTVLVDCLHPAYKKKFTVKILVAYKKNLKLNWRDEDPRVQKALDDMFAIYYERRNADQPPSTGGVRYEYKYTYVFNIYYL